MTEKGSQQGPDVEKAKEILREQDKERRRIYKAQGILEEQEEKKRQTRGSR